MFSRGCLWFYLSPWELFWEEQYHPSNQLSCALWGEDFLLYERAFGSAFWVFCSFEEVLRFSEFVIFSWLFIQNKIFSWQIHCISARELALKVNKILFHSAISDCKVPLGFARKCNTHEASDDTRYGSDKSLPNILNLLLYLYPNSHFRTPSSSQGLNLKADRHTAQSFVFGRPCWIRSARSFRSVFFLKTVFFEILIFEEDFYQSLSAHE